MKDEFAKAKEFYRRNPTIFYGTLLEDGDRIDIDIQARRDVESGLWFTFQWIDREGTEHQAEAQTLTLCIERAVEDFIRFEAQSFQRETA